MCCLTPTPTLRLVESAMVCAAGLVAISEQVPVAAPEAAEAEPGPEVPEPEPVQAGPEVPGAVQAGPEVLEAAGLVDTVEVQEVPEALEVPGGKLPDTALLWADAW
jgi:hypothetical protein